MCYLPILQSPYPEASRTIVLGLQLSYSTNYCVTRAYTIDSVRIAGGLGGLNPPTSSCRLPYLWSKFDPGGGRVSTPPPKFAEVGMLLDSHFLLMQFLKYLQCDDLNVTTILIHIED